MDHMIFEQPRRRHRHLMEHMMMDHMMMDHMLFVLVLMAKSMLFEQYRHQNLNLNLNQNLNQNHK
jgi:hypothetical protein